MPPIYSHMRPSAPVQVIGALASRGDKNIAVHRCIFRICPSDTHPRWDVYQKGTAVVLMSSESGLEVESKATVHLRKLHWDVESLTKHDVIIDDLTEEDGELFDAHAEALSGNIVVKHSLDKQPMSLKSAADVPAPERFTEAHIDEVVERAGGRRIQEEDVGGFENKNADYLLGNIVFELKDLQQEGLEIPTRQDKVYELLSSYLPQGDVVDISRIELSAVDFHNYCEIIGKPIKKRLTEANKQIKSTIEQMGNRNLDGGVIILNTGYWSIEHDLLNKIVHGYTDRGFSAINHVVVASSFLTTDGHNHLAQFGFYPNESENPDLAALCSAFYAKAFGFMAPGKMHLVDKDKQQVARKLFSFERDGKLLTIPAPLPKDLKS